MPLLARLVVAWALNTIALWVADQLFDGVYAQGWSQLILAGAILGIVSALIKPILVVLSFPLILITLGLFLLVINIGLLALVDALVGGFRIDGFWTYVGTVFVVWVVNGVLSAAFDD